MSYLNLFIKSPRTVINPKILDGIIKIFVDKTHKNKDSDDGQQSKIENESIKQILLSMLYSEQEFCDDFIKTLIHNENHRFINKENMNSGLNDILNNLIDSYLSFNLLKPCKKIDKIEDYIANSMYLYLNNSEYFKFILRVNEALFEY